MLQCQLIFDDAKNILDYVKKDSVHLMFTSPMYYGAPMWKKMTLEEYIGMHVEIFSNVYKTMKSGCFAIINSSPTIFKKEIVHVPSILANCMKSAGFKWMDEMFWAKPVGIGHGKSGQPSGKRAGVFLQHPFPTYFYPNINVEYIHIFRKGVRRRKLLDHQKKRNEWELHKVEEIVKRGQIHTWNPVSQKGAQAYTPFPDEMAFDMIMLYSLEEDVVLDPFLGSGTSMTQALKLHRSAVGFEINIDNEKVIKEKVGWLQQHIEYPIEYELIKSENAISFGKPPKIEKGGEEQIEGLQNFFDLIK